jgi:hypothetical protein
LLDRIMPETEEKAKEKEYAGLNGNQKQKEG